MAAWCWSDFEEISHVRGQRRSPSKTVGGAKSSLDSNPIPARDTQGSNIPCAYQDPEIPQRLRQNCI